MKCANCGKEVPTNYVADWDITDYPAKEVVFCDMKCLEEYNHGKVGEKIKEAK